MADRAHYAMASAFAELDPRSVVTLYPGAPLGGPAWFLNSVMKRGITETQLVNHHRLPEVRLYLLRGRDPFANRPVDIAPLLRGPKPASVTAPELVPNGSW